MREDRGRWEWREGVMHIGGKDITEVANSSRLGLKVCDGAVTCLPISLDEAVDVQGIDIMEEGPIFQ